MPFLITKNKKSDSYKVVNKLNGKVYAYATKNPQKLIAAIEINKLLTKKIKNKNK